MDINVRITIDQDPWDRDKIAELEWEVMAQVYESAPVLVRKVAVLRNDGFGNLMPDKNAEMKR